MNAAVRSIWTHVLAKAKYRARDEYHRCDVL